MLPISLRPNGRRAVIVGGGDVAARKAESIAASGFPLLIVAERIGERVRSLPVDGVNTVVERAYDTRDLADAAFVVAATDDSDVNARIVADARAAGVLVCDARDPARGDFTMPATERIGELTVGVDSGGGAPAFSRRVAREIAALLGAPYAQALETLARVRSYVKETFPPGERGVILRTLAERPIDELATATTTLVCATRTSALAMIQSRSVAARLAERGIVTTMLGITTAGDRDRQTPIEAMGEVNVFVKELELALRERRADYAVHSCKDLPGLLPDDMRIAAFSRREDPRDAFCSERYADLASMPSGAVVGTSSPRRRVQLESLRPDLQYQTLRGNVDTRLRKLTEGQYDAIVLAMAGLKRLGATATHVVPFSVEQMVPAVGQGSLAVETRTEDVRVGELLAEAIGDPNAAMCVSCEREALRVLRAGCSAPLGIHASMHDGTMTVYAAFSPEPGMLTRMKLERPVDSPKQVRALGVEVAERLRTPEVVN